MDKFGCFMIEQEDELLDMLWQLCHYDSLSSKKLQLDYDALMPELEKQGFEKTTVLSALDWLRDMASKLDSEAVAADVTRVYAFEEQVFLDRETRTCLMQLEKLGILDSVTRERVVDQVLALQNQAAGASLVKWVAYLVLSTHPGLEDARERMKLFLTDNDKCLGGMH